MLVAVAPHRHSKSLDPSKGQLAPKAIYTVTHLDRVLSETYATDAHFVCYVVHGPDGGTLEAQGRLSKAGLAYAREQGFEVLSQVLAADVDNPGHAPWQSHEAAIAEVDRVGLLVPTAAIYATSKGLRIVQPMIRALPVEEAERALASWLGDLLRRGITIDASCIDWTRHFRCPHVVRADTGRPFRSPAVVRRFEPIPPPIGNP